jgi:hypothetical protein
VSVLFVVVVVVTVVSRRLEDDVHLGVEEVVSVAEVAVAKEVVQVEEKSRSRRAESPAVCIARGAESRRRAGGRRGGGAAGSGAPSRRLIKPARKIVQRT